MTRARQHHQLPSGDPAREPARRGLGHGLVPHHLGRVEVFRLAVRVVLHAVVEPRAMLGVVKIEGGQLFVIGVGQSVNAAPGNCTRERAAGIQRHHRDTLVASELELRTVVREVEAPALGPARVLEELVLVEVEARVLVQVVLLGPRQHLQPESDAAPTHRAPLGQRREHDPLGVVRPGVAVLLADAESESAWLSSSSKSSGASSSPPSTLSPTKAAAASWTTSWGTGAGCFSSARAAGAAVAGASAGGTQARCAQAESATPRPSPHSSRRTSVASIAQRLRQELAGLAARDHPQLVSGAGHSDVEQVSCLVLHGIGRVADLDQHDVVELEALHLPHVGHVDAGAEGEVLVGDAAQVRHLGLA